MISISVFGMVQIEKARTIATNVREILWACPSWRRCVESCLSNSTFLSFRYIKTYTTTMTIKGRNSPKNLVTISQSNCEPSLSSTSVVQLSCLYTVSLIVRISLAKLALMKVFRLRTRDEMIQTHDVSNTTHDFNLALKGSKTALKSQHRSETEWYRLKSVKL